MAIKNRLPKLHLLYKKKGRQGGESVCVIFPLLLRQTPGAQFYFLAVLKKAEQFPGRIFQRCYVIQLFAKSSLAFCTLQTDEAPEAVVQNVFGANLWSPPS